MGISIKRLLVGVLADTFQTYSTVKIVQVPNTWVASIYRALQLVIVAYIAIYIVWIKKGYQQFQEPRGTSIIKVKGLAKVIGSDSVASTGATLPHLWDTAEYQIPPLENNAFFIATRQLVTYDQVEGECESALDEKLFCDGKTPSQCPKGQQTPNTFGYFTGRCVPSTKNATVSVCEIHAWCPEEMAKSTEYFADTAEIANFTVFLKTMVTFTLFNVNMRNIRDDTNFSCRYDKKNDPRCPIIRIGDVLNSLKTNTTALLREGGLVEIRQDWQCNFDYDANKCYPKLEFRVLQSGDDKQSPGVNYRSAQKYRLNNIDYRMLSKIYGLRFVVVISGKGGQFDIVNLFVAIGSGIGFMVIAGIVCDAIFMHIHKARRIYREGKFSTVEINASESSAMRKMADENADDLQITKAAF